MRWSSKNVLITGGAGFIGSCLTDRLLRENADVRILDNFSTGDVRNIPDGVGEVIRGDVCDPDLSATVKDVDYVFHFGAPSSSVLFKRDQQSCITSTIYGFLNVLELSKAIGVRKVIHPSSCTVYGDAPIPHAESTPLRPHTTYAISKVACEHLADLYTSEFPAVGLRIFTGYGPQERVKVGFSSVVTRFLTYVARDERPRVFGSGTQTRDFVYIDDIVEAAVKAAEVAFSGIVNVGSGRATTFNRLIGVIGALLDKTVEPVYVGSPNNYVDYKLADTTQMKQVLEIDPLPLEEGLNRYLTKLRDEE